MASTAQAQGVDPPDAQLLALLERVEARTRSLTPGSPDASGSGSGEHQELDDPAATGESTGDVTLGSLSPLGTPTSPEDLSGHRRQRSRSVFESDYEPASHATLTTVTSVNIGDLARRLKRARRLGPQSEIDLDMFLAAQPVAREAQQYAVSLECRDMLKTMTLEQEYKMPETLKRTAQDYGWAYMLSPTIQSYCAVDASDKVLAVMRELGVANIPPAHETARCDAVLACIGKALTDCRHHIKNKVSETLKTGAQGPKDIASLCAAIANRSKVKPTAAMYMRVAAVRYIVRTYPECVGEDAFWIRFNKQLNQYRELLKTPVKIQAAFEDMYESDKRLYGDPDILTHPTLNPNHQDEWISALERAAARPASKTASGTTNTRRRVKRK
ncbi:hypothetical protein OH77DRAFT_302393 [Trametes cingulata]|nr:hypothetical protein OH77DRAFT_302393 [Trametes cingulata]